MPYLLLVLAHLLTGSLAVLVLVALLTGWLWVLDSR